MSGDAGSGVSGANNHSVLKVTRIDILSILAFSLRATEPLDFICMLYLLMTHCNLAVCLNWTVISEVRY